MVNLEVNLAGIKLKNPVLTASGTFGFEAEYQDLLDFSQLGAYLTKTITLKPKAGNPPPRLVETPGGLLNSIGLQNKGIENFIKADLPKLAKLGTPIIVSIAGESIAEFEELADKLNQPGIAGLELNVSCPNVEKGGINFGVDPKSMAEVIRAVKTHTRLPLITKLSPNVTNIKTIAKAAEEAGSDALSLINTLLGMAIDIQTRKPRLALGAGGLSGPAIKPLAVRMVYEVYQTVKIPIIGMGGISNGADAIEFMLAGAAAVAVGTANFSDPKLTLKIISEIETYCQNQALTSLVDLTGRISRF